MTLKVACPHCHTPLLLPEGCGGQLTRCPNCLENFFIPHVAIVPVARVLNGTEPGPDASQPAPQPTEADLQRAQQRLDTLTAESAGLQVELARRAHYRDQLQRRLGRLRRFQQGRTAIDHSLGRIGGFFITLTVAPALAIVLANTLAFSAFTSFVVAALTTVAAGLAYLPFAFVPSDEHLAMLIPRVEEWLAEAVTQHDLLAAGADVHREALADAQRELQRIRAAAVISRLV